MVADSLSSRDRRVRNASSIALPDRNRFGATDWSRLTAIRKIHTLLDFSCSLQLILPTVSVGSNTTRPNPSANLALGTTLISGIRDAFLRRRCSENKGPTGSRERFLGF